MSHAGLTLVIAPAEEPLSLAEVKLWLRVDHSEEDALISRLITSAREMAERDFDRRLVTQTCRLHLDAFPCHEEIFPVGPVQSVSSITYVDQSGVTQTVSSSVYTLRSGRDPAALALAYNQVWPADVRAQPDAVAITFVAGYGSAVQVPTGIKLALELTILSWYARLSESSSLPEAAVSRLRSYWDGRY